jgi:hypothetical protein
MPAAGWLVGLAADARFAPSVSRDEFWSEYMDMLVSTVSASRSAGSGSGIRRPLQFA